MIDPPKPLADALSTRYALERELGAGGMATVYLARDLRHERPVAVKVLRAELSESLGPERFQREIRLAARLQHPHILPVHDSGADAGRLWYTMPYVEGESLRDRLRREGQLPVDDALRITREVAEALGYAHAQGIVHRDIKPENILLSQGHALVADFGVALALEAGEAALTGTGVSVGTPAYMSPEQSVADPRLDGRSDLYSLGCVLYEMLVGEAPYTGPSAQAVITKRLHDPVPSARRLRETVPASVDRALLQVLAKAPADRFASAAAFRQALDMPMAETQPQHVGAPFPAGPARVAGRPWISRKGLAVLGTLGLAITGGIGLWRLSHLPATNGPTRLAVLPFDNLGDTARAYVADGIVDAIRGKLAATSALQVIASTSSEEYRGTRKSAREIGRELEVPYIVVGKARWIDQSPTPVLQVSCELIQTATGSTRWQNPMQAAPTEIASLPVNISSSILSVLKIPLNDQERVVVSDTLTQDPAAYDAYLRGRQSVQQFEKGSAPSLEPSLALFRRAIEIDTGFVLAKVHLADALRRTADRDSTRLAEAESLLVTILRRRPNLAEALVVQADLERQRGRFDAGLRLMERAAAMRPNDAFVLGRLTWLQSLLLDSTALVTARRAVLLAPRDPDMLRLVVAGTFVFRQFDEAQRYAERLIALDPSDYMGHLNKALAEAFGSGDTAAAARTLANGERMIGILPSPMAWGYAAIGPSGWGRWHRLSLARVAATTASDTLDYYFYQAQIALAENREQRLRAYADSIVARATAASMTDPGWRAVAWAIQAFGHAVRHERRAALDDLSLADSMMSKAVPASQEQLRTYFVPALSELGLTDRALLLARRVVERPTGFTRRSLRLSPEFAGLWGLAEFDRLVADSGVP